MLPILFLLFGCPSDDNDMTNNEEPVLQNVTIEVIQFEFTPDTGNNSSRLEYEIRFTNPYSLCNYISYFNANNKT